MEKKAFLDSLKKLLASGQIHCLLGYKRVGGQVVPYLFTTEDQLEELDFESLEKNLRYPIAGTAKRIVEDLGETKLGILVRGCDERALLEMAKWNQIDLRKIVFIGIACSMELAKQCLCRKPYPEEDIILGDPIKEVFSSEEAMAFIENLPLEERKNFWNAHFERCIKCYGCRNICPLCFCADCSLEDPMLIEKSPSLPPELPIFHLVRAFHMAGRCIDCGLCEEACPANIPLRILYKKVNNVVEKNLGYVTGERDDKICPLNVIA